MPLSPGARPAPARSATQGHSCAARSCHELCELTWNAPLAFRQINLTGQIHLVRQELGSSEKCLTESPTVHIFSQICTKKGPWDPFSHSTDIFSMSANLQNLQHFQWYAISPISVLRVGDPVGTWLGPQVTSWQFGAQKKCYKHAGTPKRVRGLSLWLTDAAMSVKPYLCNKYAHRIECIRW